MSQVDRRHGLLPTQHRQNETCTKAYKRALIQRRIQYTLRIRASLPIRITSIRFLLVHPHSIPMPMALRTQPFVHINLFPRSITRLLLIRSRRFDHHWNPLLALYRMVVISRRNVNLLSIDSTREGVTF